MSAERGDKFSQRILAVFYANGFSVEQSFEESVKWCRLSAEQGDPESQCNLGTMLRTRVSAKI